MVGRITLIGAFTMLRCRRSRWTEIHRAARRRANVPLVLADQADPFELVSVTARRDSLASARTPTHRPRMIR
jgi:hypothetical protein